MWNCNHANCLTSIIFAFSVSAVLFSPDTTKSEVEEFIRQDPYVSNGVVTDYKIREWTVAVGSSANPNLVLEPVKVGDSFPQGAVLYEGTPAGEIKMDEFLKGKKVIIFAVPGAFTPGCSKVGTIGQQRRDNEWVRN